MKIKGQKYKITGRGIFIALLVVLIGGAGVLFGMDVFTGFTDKSAVPDNGDAIAASGETDDDPINVDQPNESGHAEEVPVSSEPKEGTDPIDGRKTKINDSSKDLSILVVINKKNHLESDYVPHILKQVADYVPGKDEAYSYARVEACDAFDKLLVDAKEAGLKIIASNAYRSYNVQKNTFEYNVKQKGSEEAANKTSARPGESEHQTGLAIDLTTKELDYQVVVRFEDTAEGQWIKENCYKYGFIIRFPKGKEDITGYSYEPWHIRYVGEDVAKDIHTSGSTLEEYMEME